MSKYIGIVIIAVLLIYETVLDVKEKSDSEMEGAAEKTAVARPTESDSNNSILSSPEKSNAKAGSGKSCRTTGSC